MFQNLTKLEFKLLTALILNATGREKIAPEEHDHELNLDPQTEIRNLEVEIILTELRAGTCIITLQQIQFLE